MVQGQGDRSTGSRVKEHEENACLKESVNKSNQRRWQWVAEVADSHRSEGLRFRSLNLKPKPRIPRRK